MSILVDEWTGCYKRGWLTVLRPESYCHPAKGTYSLAERIYQHLDDERWITPGMTVLDPFGGIGGFAYHAMLAGLNFIGIELEQKFHRLAQGMDCPGFGAAYFRRYHRRGTKWDALNICPECAAILDGTHLIQYWFGQPARTIPTVAPHHYQGNLERWGDVMPGRGIMLQGDSRRLLAVIGKAGLAISSPPYAASLSQGNNPDTYGQTDLARKEGGQLKYPVRYGDSPGQLGRMKDDGFAQVMVSSPPFRQTTGGTNVTSDSGPLADAALVHRHAAGNIAAQGYGAADGQLANMPEGQFDVGIGSPPYSEGLGHGGGTSHIPHDTRGTAQAFRTGYGAAPGQLANMSEGSAQACVSSPPFTGSTAEDRSSRAGKYWTFTTGHPKHEKSNDAYGKTRYELHNQFPYMSPEWIDERRRQSEQANLARLPEEAMTVQTFWEAAAVIVAQTYAALRPGAHAVFVLKRFVRDGQIVNFPQQWATLCESVGFQLVHWHRAMLTEDKGTQLAHDGNHKHYKTSRFSFFRRLHAKKYPHLSIDWEDCICLVKPEKESRP